MSNEQQQLIENAILRDFQQGRLNRRQFMQLMLMVGMGAAGVSALAGNANRVNALPLQGTPAASTRPLTPTFYQWIIDLHPGVQDVNKAFGDLNFQIAPVSGFDVARFVAEGKNQQSTWDVYVGMTPFVEMASLIKAGVIEPWDNYIPKDVIDDILPAIRAECTVDGKLYSWPFFLDIIVQGNNGTLIKNAGLT